MKSAGVLSALLNSELAESVRWKQAANVLSNFH